jgi:5'-3' exonuclease
VDGVPPKEKMEELAQRRQQREQAYKQAEALKAFLADPESQNLDTQAREVIEKKINAYEVESYSIKKEIRDEFLKKIAESICIPIIMCDGESDTALIEASKNGEVDIVIANDMDLFVGGVERLWVLGKTNSDPLFLEFLRSDITRQLGLHSKSWIDIAILAGYEKTPQLKRHSVQQAISVIRYYGCFENLFKRRMDLLQGNSVEEFIEARKFF